MWDLGTLFLEFIPKEKQNLLTFLSIFFSCGSVFSSGLAWGILPKYSCPDEGECDVDQQNQGWRYMLIALGLMNIVMVILRLTMVKLHESPRFLVQNKRQQDAVIVLREIARYNGNGGSIRIATNAFYNSNLHRSSCDGTADDDDEDSNYSRQTLGAGGGRDGANHSNSISPSESDDNASSYHEGLIISPVATPRRHQQQHPAYPKARAIRNVFNAVRDCNPTNWPQIIKHKLCNGIRRTEPLFSPSLCRTTTLVWIIWGLVSLGFTMFNAFLPKMLELHGSSNASPSSMGKSEVYRDTLLYAVSGLPGSVIGAWLVDTFLGRRYSMALATFSSCGCLLAFSWARTSLATVISSSTFGLVTSLMYAIIYAYTPEVFHAAVRGTGCGVASALSRIAGIIAPLIAGPLVQWSLNGTLYTSIGILCVSGICMTLLPIETRGRAV